MDREIVAQAVTYVVGDLIFEEATSVSIQGCFGMILLAVILFALFEVLVPDRFKFTKRLIYGALGWAHTQFVLSMFKKTLVLYSLFPNLLMFGYLLVFSIIALELNSLELEQVSVLNLDSISYYISFTLATTAYASFDGDAATAIIAGLVYAIILAIVILVYNAYYAKHPRDGGVLTYYFFISLLVNSPGWLISSLINRFLLSILFSARPTPTPTLVAIVIILIGLIVVSAYIKYTIDDYQKHFRVKSSPYVFTVADVYSRVFNIATLRLGIGYSLASDTINQTIPLTLTLVIGGVLVLLFILIKMIATDRNETIFKPISDFSSAILIYAALGLIHNVGYRLLLSVQFLVACAGVLALVAIVQIIEAERKKTYYDDGSTLHAEL